MKIHLTTSVCDNAVEQTYVCDNGVEQTSVCDNVVEPRPESASCQRHRWRHVEVCQMSSAIISIGYVGLSGRM